MQCLFKRQRKDTQILNRNLNAETFWTALVGSPDVLPRTGRSPMSDTKMKIKLPVGRTLKIGDSITIEIDSFLPFHNRATAAYLVVTAPEEIRFSGTCLAAREADTRKEPRS